MPARTRRPLWAALAFVLGALAVTLPVVAQTPPDPGQKKGEEEEKPKDRKAPKKIDVPDDPTPPTTPGEPGKTPPEQETEGGAYVAKLDDVARAAAAAPHPAIKTFLTPYAIAFDRVTLRNF